MNKCIQLAYWIKYYTSAISELCSVLFHWLTWKVRMKMKISFWKPFIFFLTTTKFLISYIYIYIYICIKYVNKYMLCIHTYLYINYYIFHACIYMIYKTYVCICKHFLWKICKQWISMCNFKNQWKWQLIQLKLNIV